jgi:RNA polymerase sigma factor (sigma-70 family)
MMLADKELLGQYAKGRSESAFAELARRHLPLVYSAALRQAGGDTHLAQDVCQMVFADLARKAAQLAGRSSIAGWLYTSARFAASKIIRSEVRRRNRETTVSPINNETSNAPWAELRDLLDAAMNELGRKDREAIVLRYFESCDFADVGAALGTTQNAARMRVDRALDKLRSVLERRGVRATGSVLAAALAESTAAAVPAGLASSVTATALATAPAAAGGLLLLGGVAAVAASLTVLLWWQIPTSPQDAPPPPVISHTDTVEAVSPARELSVPKGDPYQLQKLAQRHDAQVRMHPAAPNDWFTQAMKDEPGIKKYGARLKTTIPPGVTLIGGGWRITAGTRILFVVTPDLDTHGPDQVDISSRFIEVPETMFDNPELQGFQSAENDQAVVRQMSTELADRLVNAITNQPDGGVLSAPRVTTLLGREARVSSSDNQAGHGGQTFDFNATRSTDGASIDLDMAACCALPDSPGSAQ